MEAKNTTHYLAQRSYIFSDFFDFTSNTYGLRIV